MEEVILFLNKLELQEYLKDFTGDQSGRRVKKLGDFEFYLEKEEHLEALGLSDVEIKRFIRMCGDTILVGIFCLCVFVYLCKQIGNRPKIHSRSSCRDRRDSSSYPLQSDISYTHTVQ